MRLIDADSFEANMQNEWERNEISNGEWIHFREMINAEPTIEPERKKGEWVERNPQNSDRCRLIECDQCGFAHIVGFNVPYEDWVERRNFCERCGADMRGEGGR